jgi:hypothetical protein
MDRHQKKWEDKAEQAQVTDLELVSVRKASVKIGSTVRPSIQKSSSGKYSAMLALKPAASKTSLSHNTVLALLRKL